MKRGSSIIRNRHPELVDSHSLITSCQDLWLRRSGDAEKIWSFRKKVEKH